MHLLAQLWPSPDGPVLSVRFTGPALLRLGLLTLRLDPGSRQLQFRSGRSVQLVFRVNSLCLVARVRLVARLATRLICLLPRDVQIRQLRAKKRTSVRGMQGLRCELHETASQGLGSAQGKPASVEIVDISAGGLRLKLIDTRRSLVFNLGQLLNDVLVSLEQPGWPLLQSRCQLKVSNILVREEWDTELDASRLDRHRSTFLGLTFAQLEVHDSAQLAQILARIEQDPVEAVVPSLDELRLVAQRSEGAKKDP